MRKIAAILALFSLYTVTLLSSHAQTQTRPRRVGQTSEASTATGNEGEEVDEGDVVRVNTTLITVPVSVTDRNGRYVPYLHQEDFRIYEDGVEHQIAHFAPVEKPFTVALVLDTSASTRFRLEDIQDAAIAFIDQLRPDDRVMLVSFDDDVRLLAEATSDRHTLRRAIRRTRTGDRTRLYDAVDFIINQRLNLASGRKAIVLFTDGVDTTSRQATYASNVRDAEELDALIYTVQYDTYAETRQDNRQPIPNGQTIPQRQPVPSRQPDPQPQPTPGKRRIPQWPLPTTIKIPGLPFPIPIPVGDNNGRRPLPVTGMPPSVIFRAAQQNPTTGEDYKRADSYLRELTQKTGGRIHHADTTRNLAQAFSLIAEELRIQYSLGYYPKMAARAGQRRQISVRVNRPEMIVRSRDSYISDTEAHVTAQSNQRQPFRPEANPDKFAPAAIERYSQSEH